EYVGYGAADAAIQALDDDATIVDQQAFSIAMRRRSLLIGATNVKLALAVSAGLIPRALFHADTKTQLTPEELEGIGIMQITEGEIQLQTEVNVIELGPLAIAAIPGEMYPELWLEAEGGGHYLERPQGADFPDAPFETPIQSMLPDDSIPVIINNANDATGYIIPYAQWDEVAPYAYVEEGEGAQYGEENSLGAQTAPSLNEAFGMMMDGAP
ncbi:MAG: hypothetical protein ACOC1F_12505, partial [Myxococcota bacterium]